MPNQLDAAERQVADHVEHIVKVAGIDHVGIGSDFDGVGDLPGGLSGVETYPALLAELMRRGWSDVAIAKLADGSFARTDPKSAVIYKIVKPNTIPVSIIDSFIKKK